MRRIIREYTEESGVRNLEREIGALCRKVARVLAGDDPPESLMIDAPQVSEYLGVPKYDYGLAEEQDEVGVATGAAVTSVGGDRFVIPTAHRETSEDAYNLRGACGFSFGNGCSPDDKGNLFAGGKLKAKNPMEVA